MIITHRTTIALALAGGFAAAASAQGSLDERLQRLEQQNQELQRQLEAISRDLERKELGVTAPGAVGQEGTATGARKVYAVDQGLSIGGYGETWFTQRSGRPDTADALRAILYVGYRFDEQWLFHSELEVEHATTDDGSGEVSLEQGYLERRTSDAFNLRAGLLLAPMGLVNEVHEPTSFLPASRAQTEQRILPTTWRELGLSAHGDVGAFAYRAALVTSLDGAGFAASGLRGGRQQGSKVEADDWSGILRVDYVDVPGLMLGGSVSYGDTGQDGFDDNNNAIPDLRTTIFEGHLDYRTGPWTVRALYASARVQDAGAFDAATGNNLADRMNGWYAELGHDLLAALAADSRQSLTPFVRYEVIDTQASMPTGFAADPTQKDRILTVGLNYQPIPQVTIKVDFENWDDDHDRFNILFGYVF